MTRKQVGLVLFWIGAVWAVLWGILGSIGVTTAFRTSTMAELDQTMWAFLGFWHALWGLSTPTAAVVAGVGILLYAGAGVSTALKYGVGILVASVLALALTLIGYFPSLFGIGGSLILLAFLGTLWFWAKERVGLEGAGAAAANLRLAAYVFFVMAAWFTCGLGSEPFLRAFEGQSPSNPWHVQLLLMLGWLFLLLSHHKSSRPEAAQV